MPNFHINKEYVFSFEGFLVANTKFSSVTKEDTHPLRAPQSLNNKNVKATNFLKLPDNSINAYCLSFLILKSCWKFLKSNLNKALRALCGFLYY